MFSLFPLLLEGEMELSGALPQLPEGEKGRYMHPLVFYAVIERGT